MNRGKDIQDIVKLLTDMPLYDPNGLVADRVFQFGASQIAYAVVSAGYGDVKQAVKEFASELKQRACAVRNSTFDLRLVVDVKTIDDLITELYGADEKC